MFGKITLTDLSIHSWTMGENIPMMWDKTGNYAIVLDGELYDRTDLYNYIDDADLLTDAELILEGYIKCGKEVLNLLDGVFVFAVYSKIDNSVFIARDPFGVKFLYYWQTPQQFVFASGIPPILKNSEYQPAQNERLIYDYLVFNRTDHTEDTFFDGIRKMLHGYCAIINSDGVKWDKWYDLKERVLAIENADPKEFLNKLTGAIQKRMPSVEKLGVCLSGGLDSSAIVSILVKLLNQDNLHTFSSVYGENCNADESYYINQFSDMISNMHYIHPSADSLMDDMHMMICNQVEPTPSTSPYAHYCVLKEAQKFGIEISMDGQGADEALAGYEYIPGLYLKSLLKQCKIKKLIHEIVTYYRLHGSTRHLKYMVFFMLPSSLRTKVRVKQRKYINSTFANQYTGGVISEQLYGSNDLKEMLINHFEYKLEHLLKWGEINTKAFGIRCRMPFLDHKFVEYAIALSDDEKIYNGYTKHILRHSLTGIMPEKVRLRVDKKGFAVPQDEWFRTEAFQQRIYDILQSNSFQQRGYILSNEAIKLYNCHIAGNINISKDIWKWINLELWFREYID